MANFIALYRGESIGSASLVAVTTDRELVARVADEMLARERRQPSDDDPVAGAMEKGRRKALELVRDEAEDEGDAP